MTTPKTTASAREALSKINVRQLVDEYEFRGDGFDHTPTEDERALLEDFGNGLLSAIDAALAESAGDAKAEPESAPAAEPLPRDVGVVLDAVRGALDGRPYALRDAFVWAGTPQGDDFWRAQDNARRLSPEGEAILRATLADREG